MIREQAQVITDSTQSTRDNSKVCVVLEPEYVDEEENANKDGIVIWEQEQDIADTTQPGNVDKTTEACRTSTTNKKNPSIRGKVFFMVNKVYSWENDASTSKPMNSKNLFKIFHQNIRGLKSKVDELSNSQTIHTYCA